MDDGALVKLAASNISEIRVTHVKSLSQKLFDVGMFAGVLFITWKMMSKVMDKMSEVGDGNGDKSQAKARKDYLLRKLRLLGRKIQDFHCNTYENSLLEYVTLPSQIQTTFLDIGGLEEQKNSLKETVLLPLRHHEQLQQYSALLCPPTGVLFYGPPGTGKTMMAKAIAKTASSTFIYLKISAVMSKWYGETSKLINAVFSLADKLAPTIIFIDELDAFLGKRRMSEHTADAHAKALFLSLWDGLSSTRYSGVIVLGCSNRPWEIDEAILRRLPRQYKFGLPNEKERKEILDIFLDDTPNKTDTAELARITEKFSGSDLQELCKMACSIPLSEVLKAMSKENSSINKDLNIRAVEQKDFKTALKKVKPSWVNAERYRSNRTVNIKTDLNDLD